MAILPERDKYKILLIEDNLIDRKLIHEFIEQTKFTEFELKDTDRLSSGLQLLADESFDAVLLDLFLPDARKLEALDKIIDCKVDLPIVILTGLGDEDLGISAVRKGAQDYLVKGDFERSLLIRSLTYAIERKRAEIALVESEKKYRMLFESSGEGRIISDSTGMILDANPAAAAILGYKSPEELKKTSINELYMYPEQRKAIFKKIIKEEFIDNVEITGKKRDETLFYALASLIAHKDEEGEILQVDGVFRDITARKRAEKALQQKTHDLEERVKELNCLYGVSQLTRDPQRPIDEVLRQVTLLVPQAWQYPSITCARIILKEKTHMTENFQETRWRQVANIIVSDKKIGTVEVYYLKDMPVIFEGPFLKEERDLIDSLARELGNFNERQQIRNELYDSEARFRQLVNRVREIIFTFDLNGSITSLNPAFEVLTGWTRDKFIGKPFAMLVHTDDLSIVMDGFESFSKGKKPANFDVRIKTKLGKCLVIEGRVEPQFDQGELTGYLGSAHDITERKQIEEDLKKAKKRLDYLITSNPAVIYTCEPKGKYQTIYMSSNVKKITGYEPPDFVGKNDFWVEGLHPEDRQRVTNAYQENIIETGHFNDVYRFRHKDGTYRWVLEEAKLITDDQGNPQEIIGYWTDITERKKIEEALQKSEEKYRTIFQKCTDAIFIIELTNDNIPGRFIEVNDRARRNLGYSNEEFHKMSPKEIVDQELHDKIPKILEEFSKKGHISVELIFVSKNNQKTPVEVNSHLVTIRGDKRMLIVARDITKRKETMTALREREEKYRNLIENLMDTVVELDSQGNFTFVSPQVFELTGYKPEELIGKSSLDFIYPDDLETVTDVFERALEGKTVINYECRARHKDNQFVWISSSGRVVGKEDSFELVVILKDITDRKQAVELLKESEERLKSLFEEAPISLWEEDYSDLKKYLNRLQMNGITNLREFFDTHPKEVRKIDQMIKVLDINKVTLKLFAANNKKQLLSNIDSILREEYYSKLQEALVSYNEGKTSIEGETIVYQLTGDPINVLVKSNVVPGYEESFSKVYTSIINITELLRMEKSLKQSEDRFRQFLDSTNESFYLLDSKLNILDVNKNVENILKIAKEDLIGKNIFILDPTIKEKSSYSGFMEVIKTGKPLIEDNVVSRPKFGQRHYSVRVFKAGDGLGIMSADITQQIQNQEALQESQRRFSLFMDYLPSVAFIKDNQSNFLFVNEAMKEISGEVDWIGKNTLEVYPKHLAEMMIADDKKALSKGYYLREEKIPDKNGTKRLFQTHKFVIKQRKKPPLLGAIALDITEIKQAELALKESEERFRTIFNRAPIGMTISDLNYQFIKVNEIFCQMLGYTMQELTKKTFRDITHPDHIKRDVENIKKLGKGEMDVFRTEKRYIKKDNEIIWVRTSVNLLFDDVDEPFGYLAMIEDITHQKRIEEETRKQLMKFKIEDGNLYLISESRPALSEQVFCDLIQVGYSGLAISRMPETEFKRDIDAEFQFLWLSETKKKNSLPPQLKGLEKIIEGMQAKSVIWIDRLDYLVLKNSFEETLKSVFRWREIAYLNDLVVLLSVDPTTLTKNQIHSLRKETKAVEPRFLVRVPADMLEVLRFVYQQNNLGVKPSYTDIGNELEISKPTTRKRIKELVATGYLNEQKSGNRKILELTEKGFNVFKK